MSDTASTPLTGGCGCGRVRWELTAPPRLALYCHCTRCQRRSGTGASANAVLEPGSFRLTQGEEDVRFWSPPTGMEKGFCGRCGSAVLSRDRADHAKVGVRLGSFDGDPGVRPSLRQWTSVAAPWESIPDDGLPRHPESRTSTP